MPRARLAASALDVKQLIGLLLDLALSSTRTDAGFVAIADDAGAMCIVDQDGPRRVLHLDGALDVSSAIQLREILGDQLHGPDARVLVDLSAVRLLDSSGIGIFVTAHRRAAALGARLVLAAPQPSVGKVFELTRTNRLLLIVPSVAEGCAALEAA